MAVKAHNFVPLNSVLYSPSAVSECWERQSVVFGSAVLVLVQS